jgi:hypothetical protein
VSQILYTLWIIKRWNKEHTKNVSLYENIEQKYLNILNFDEIKFPVKVQDIKKFCRMNKNKSINVYLNEVNKILSYATYFFKKEKRENNKNLLLLNLNENYHYIYINYWF